MCAMPGKGQGWHGTWGAREVSRTLDLYCGAGGATRGYQSAGFYVVGVDIAPQKHYIGDAFIQADAFDVLYALAHGDCWPDSTGRD